MSVESSEMDPEEDLDAVEGSSDFMDRMEEILGWSPGNRLSTAEVNRELGIGDELDLLDDGEGLTLDEDGDSEPLNVRNFEQRRREVLIRIALERAIRKVETPASFTASLSTRDAVSLYYVGKSPAEGEREMDGFLIFPGMGRKITEADLGRGINLNEAETPAEGFSAVQEGVGAVVAVDDMDDVTMNRLLRKAAHERGLRRQQWRGLRGVLEDVLALLDRIASWEIGWGRRDEPQE